MKAASFIAVSASLFLLAFPANSAAQAKPDTLTGRAISDSTSGIPAAAITITRAPDRLVQRTVTDSSGYWKLIFADGTGDYLVHAIAPGYNSARKRVLRDSTGKLRPVDLKLASMAAAQTIAPVRVSEARPRPERESFEFDKIGSNDNTAVGLLGAIPPTIAGDLNAVVALTPGIVSTQGGLSVLGADASGNSTTLGGMGFPGASVPRDAKTEVRVSTTAFDPSEGWFSAYRTNVELSQGNVFAFRRVSTTIDAPFLQAPVAPGADTRFTNARISSGGDGMFWGERTAYSYGVEGTRRSSPFQSIQFASDQALRTIGVSPDSVKRFLGLAAPAFARRAADPFARSTSENVSMIARIDRAGYDFKTYEPRDLVLGAVGFLNIGRNGGIGGSPFASFENAGEATSSSGGVQGIFSKFVRKRLLLDTRTSLSVNRTESRPLTELPSGSVVVLSDYGTGSLSSLEFGGGATSASSRNTLWETLARADFYWDKASRHSAVVAADLRYDGFSNRQNANANGSFLYNSLADLERNAPAMFSRSLGDSERSGGEWNGFLSISDRWRPWPKVRVMAGVRMEGNRFSRAPLRNAAIEQVFGVRNDRVPNGVHVSPRLGFTWVRTGMFRHQTTNMGSYGMNPASFIRGGIGEFRAFTSPQLLSGASAYTGLPGAVRQISCIGSSVPFADWMGFAEGASDIPSDCIGPSAGSFRDAAPHVELLDVGYKPSRSWRANFGYGSIFHDFPYAIDLLSSLNLDQPGRTNLNFAGVEQFRSGGENRPVFAAPSGIVSSTGLVSANGSRISTQFGSVIQGHSRLRSFGSQMTMSLRTTPRGNLLLAGAYTLGSVRSLESGYDGSTFGDPRATSWGRASSDVRHQFVLQAGRTFLSTVFKGTVVTAVGTVQSGLPYTPIVASDVNGDGFRNDRAFVFPAMSGQGAGLSDAGADCLRRQVGAVARRNACEGPWSVVLNAQITRSFEIKRYGRDAMVGLAIANPLGGLDQLLHGNELRGWGGIRAADPVLYSVSGFNRATGSFAYNINPGFGSPRSSYFGLATPFRVTLDVRMNVGRSLPQQQMEKWLRPGRGKPGKKLGVADLKKRYSRNVNDPYRGILAESDSLLLTREQGDSIRAAQKRTALSADSLWTTMADKLVLLPDNFDSKAALAIQESAIDDAWELYRMSVKNTLGRILSPLQLSMLPWDSRNLWLSTKPMKLRTYMF